LMGGKNWGSESREYPQDRVEKQSREKTVGRRVLILLANAPHAMWSGKGNLPL